ncbi:MAG: SemiSWEET family sugar transporter [Xanthobacteraceae bacterium]
MSTIATTVIGTIAAVCCCLAYIPQWKKCWQTRSTGDLSLAMFSSLTVGVGLWIVYGVLQNDLVIVIANAVAFVPLLGILYLKVRATLSGERSG